MKVGEIVPENELPKDVLSLAGHGAGKWAPVREALAQLEDGEWLTVECESTEELIRLRNATASTNSKYKAVKRGLTLYYTKKKVETT